MGFVEAIGPESVRGAGSVLCVCFVACIGSRLRPFRATMVSLVKQRDVVACEHRKHDTVASSTMKVFACRHEGARTMKVPHHEGADAIGPESVLCVCFVACVGSR